MEFYHKYKNEIITGIIVGAIILLYINRNYLRSKLLGAEKEK